MNKKLCIFLRGINVNGIKIKMTELKSVFIKMGFTDTKTLLATGNVIIDNLNNLDIQELKSTIEDTLSMQFSYDAHIFIRNYEEISKITDDYKAITHPQNCNLYYILCENSIIADELDELYNTVKHADNEQFLLLERDAFWIVEKGFTLKTEFGKKILGSRKYKPFITSRNINTIIKIKDAMQN